MGFIDKCKAILTDPHPERDETHAATRYALDRAHCPAEPCRGANRELCATCIDTRKPLSVAKPLYEPELPLVDTPAQDTHAQKFAAYHGRHPELYRAIEARALETAGRISTKRIYEELRGKFPHLNNTFTADYADMLCEKHPEIAHRVERRRRAAKKMRLVYAKN